MRLLLFTCALLALASCQKGQQPTANQAASAAEAGPVKGVDRSHKGQPVPGVTFKDPDGADTSLANFAGKPLLVNLWASWCAPCVKELPTLDELSRSEGANLQVAAVSQDMGPHASVVAFLGGHKIASLEPYQDPNSALSGALGPDTVLPTSLLYDAKGREVWRYVGDLDWTSPQAARLLAEGGVAPAR